MINDTELKQVVYAYKCNKSTLQVKGKINSITIGKNKTVCQIFRGRKSHLSARWLKRGGTRTRCKARGTGVCLCSKNRKLVVFRLAVAHVFEFLCPCTVLPMLTIQFESTNKIPKKCDGGGTVHVCFPEIDSPQLHDLHMSSKYVCFVSLHQTTVRKWAWCLTMSSAS